MHAFGSKAAWYSSWISWMVWYLLRSATNHSVEDVRVNLALQRKLRIVANHRRYNIILSKARTQRAYWMYASPRTVKYTVVQDNRSNRYGCAPLCWHLFNESNLGGCWCPLKACMLRPCLHLHTGLNLQHLLIHLLINLFVHHSRR